MSHIREIIQSVKFRAVIRSQNRITVPKNLIDFQEGDNVIVILKKVEVEG